MRHELSASRIDRNNGDAITTGTTSGGGRPKRRRARGREGRGSEDAEKGGRGGGVNSLLVRRVRGRGGQVRSCEGYDSLPPPPPFVNARWG
ncbi:uncharacterized protein SCHCODRAFT_01330933 [Schizophyllum commune H4-8]|uniref:uncharacterized protein n=1 Tax=Schizophyllum commune (strain H4-8 / FGSC 9210) TaxID=578458 RepID=UPI00215FFF16|nr:uncharacterized protein SCHCODRAFT_01330933 [Schizophyllum commune H4-8]KAI5888355.1 hypothetical protein SCHCODRAFT_01330933 [Schizophyllum commune H4-8]